MKGDVVTPYFIDLATRSGVRLQTVEFASSDVLQAVADGDAVAGVTPQHYGLRFARDYGLSIRQLNCWFTVFATGDSQINIFASY